MANYTANSILKNRLSVHLPLTIHSNLDTLKRRQYLLKTCLLSLLGNSTHSLKSPDFNLRDLP